MKKQDSDNFIILGHPEKAEEVKSRLAHRHNIDPFDIKTVFADETTTGKILEELEFLPMFSKKSILHIKRSEKLNKSACEILEEYLWKPSPHNCLIISGESIKEPLAGHADITAKKDLTGLFPAIFRMSSKNDSKRLAMLLRNHLEKNERDFTPAINASFIYLRNILKKQKKADHLIKKKYKQLQQLDFDLKTGKLHPGSELEIFLFYLFS